MRSWSFVWPLWRSMKGYRRVNRDKKIIPQDQRSMAGVCSTTFNNTSGARNPRDSLSLYKDLYIPGVPPWLALPLQLGVWQWKQSVFRLLLFKKRLFSIFLFGVNLGVSSLQVRFGPFFCLYSLYFWFQYWAAWKSFFHLSLFWERPKSIRTPSLVLLSYLGCDQTVQAEAYRKFFGFMSRWMISCLWTTYTHRNRLLM